MLGGVMAQIFHQPPAPFVIVGMGAVFAGAARVPVATLLMVTEMTGDYDLLVAAGLAVMLSYLIEVNLSARFKYISLYEAQVPGRPDSPAHQVEQVEAAIRLLADENVSVPKTVGRLDLRTLLASGIPVDLPDNKNMLIGVLKQDSPFANQSIGTTPLHVDHNGIEIVAIFRDGHTLLPRPEVVLEPGDKLLLITSPQDWHAQQGNFDPLTF